MSKFPRETIVFVSAIVGVNLIGIFTQQPKPAQSNDCFQSFLPQPQQDNKGGRVEGYYDVRLKKDVHFPVQPKPETHSYLPSVVAPVAAAQADNAATPGRWVTEHRMPNASEESDYQARRRALMTPNGGI